MESIILPNFHTFSLSFIGIWKLVFLSFASILSFALDFLSFAIMGAGSSSQEAPAATTAVQNIDESTNLVDTHFGEGTSSNIFWILGIGAAVATGLYLRLRKRHRRCPRVARTGALPPMSFASLSAPSAADTLAQLGALQATAPLPVFSHEDEVKRAYANLRMGDSMPLTQPKKC